MRFKNILLIIISCLFFSCTQYKDMVYVRAKQNISDTLYYDSNYRQYLLRAGDILDVVIKSTNPELSRILGQINTRTGTTSDANRFINKRLSGYKIGKDGKIKIPIIGEIEVEGKTLEEAETAVCDAVDAKFNNAYVRVNLVSFEVTVIGEAGGSAVIFHKDKVSMLDLIARCKPTNYADLHEILILRPMEKSTKTFLIDLTRSDLLTDENFYLQPDDIVYFKPIRTKTIRIALSEYSMFLSFLSSIAGITSTLLFILSLKK